MNKLAKGSKYAVVEGGGAGYQGANDDRLPLNPMPPQQDVGKYEPYKQQYPSQTVQAQYPEAPVQQGQY